MGKILMLKTEEYCKERGYGTAYLTTHDQQVSFVATETELSVTSCLPSCSVTRQIFYSRCGYKFSESVCAFGGSSNLNLGKFAASPTVPSVLMTDQKVRFITVGALPTYVFAPTGYPC